MTTRRGFLHMISAAALTGCAVQTDDEEVESIEEESHACRTTTRDAQGPFYRSGSPYQNVLAPSTEPGERLVIEGKVLGRDCHRRLSGYVVDVWQADARGNYSNSKLRGRIRTAADGTYRFETIMPGRYADGWGRVRPAHLHVKVRGATGPDLLTTQVYFAGDPYLGRNDYCTREGTCNSSDAARILRLVRGQSSYSGTFEVSLPV